MKSEPEIADSAYKHGCQPDDIIHVFGTPMLVWPGYDGFTMIIGPARNAELLEVGYISNEVWAALIIHAMPARAKFLRR